MHPIVREKLDALVQLCDRYQVRRLELFGSAATERYGAHSDLDFLVEFVDVPTGGLFERYFGLLEALEALFERRVDLVMLRAIENPHFMAEISATRTELYAA